MVKRKSKAQVEIAEAVAVTQQARKLRKQIAILKRLPKNFRDIASGQDWEDFAEITDRREEMNEWNHGPILCLTAPDKHEEMILGSTNTLVRVKAPEVVKLTAENWIQIVQHAEQAGCAWIYLPKEEVAVINALNVLFSRFGYNIRAKGQLMSERTGKPIGVVH